TLTRQVLVVGVNGLTSRPATSISGATDRAVGRRAPGVALAIIHILAGFALVAQEVQQRGINVVTVPNQARIAHVGTLTAFGGSQEFGVMPGQRRGIQRVNEVRQAASLGFAELLTV